CDVDLPVTFPNLGVVLPDTHLNEIEADHILLTTVGGDPTLPVTAGEGRSYSRSCSPYIRSLVSRRECSYSLYGLRQYSSDHYYRSSHYLSVSRSSSPRVRLWSYSRSVSLLRRSGRWNYSRSFSPRCSRRSYSRSISPRPRKRSYSSHRHSYSSV
ncbi:Serine/threonine-rich protein like, partial [Actinidia chinensis var. chinensis]